MTITQDDKGVTIKVQSIGELIYLLPQNSQLVISNELVLKAINNK